ncbi:MAG: hypothetical protein IIW40_00290 [Clostridia bacterium]|nr:hypothetical protein [Clostridia bacterium]
MSIAAAANKILLTDFHSHCLPDLDDGASDVATAVAMLRASATQGVERVAATPHFYVGLHDAAAFFKERQRAYEDIKPLLDETMPQVVLGAEVLIREGISRYDLSPFCLQDTNILLVEMPFMAPPIWLYEELENIVNRQGLTLMYAHLDRYLSWYSHGDFEMLMDMPGSIMQVNADSIADKKYFGSLLRHLPDTRRMVIGSDMHNMNHRSPRIGQAVKVLSKHRVGREWLNRIVFTTERLENYSDDAEGLL